MKWFFDLKIAKKLFFSFAFVLLLTAVSGVFSIVQLGKVNRASTEIATNWLPTIRVLDDMKLLLSRLRSNEAQLALYEGDQEAVDKVFKKTERIVADLNATSAKYVTMITESEEKAIYPEVQKQLVFMLSEHAKIVAAIEAKDVDTAKKIFLGEGSKVYFELFANIDKLAQINTRGSELSSSNADATFVRTRLLIAGLLIVSLLIGFGMAILMARAIAKPLTVAAGVAKQVAAGDLSADIVAQSRDETGDLMRSLKEMNDSLRGIVQEVRTGTETITTASREIATGNLDLSSRTEGQAGALEETASAMEQLTATVKQNAENALQANHLAVSASEIAIAGGSVVGKVVHTMGSINDSSRQIVDIISVIDGIAFQTNILALNAAVEAARAGEQGRGFAVVASEVRSLAQRSAAAAKEIKTLIDNSVAQVDIGSQLVEEAGNTMSDVVNSVKRLTDLVSEITTASQEQSDGISQVNLAITQMDEVTQQNAALVEQASAAAQSMQDQALKLSDVVGVFKLNAHNQLAAPGHANLSRRTVDITPRPQALTE